MKENPSPQAASAAPSAAAREIQWTWILVGTALLAGFALQAFIPPGAKTLVAASLLAGAVVLGIAFLAPGRLRETLSGFRFTSTLLVVLAVMAIAGTLVLQGQPAASYAQRYGAAAPLIQTLRLDDIFHGLPFALVMALFGAAVIGSATLRWPVKARSAGFFVCHLGLLTSIGGAAASTLLAQRGMVWLPEGGQPASNVLIEKGTEQGQLRPLGFQISLDRFDLLPYESEYRLGFYAGEYETDDRGQLVQVAKLKTSFPSCDDGARCERPDVAKHVLPGGDSFRVKAYYPDYRRAAVATPAASGPAAMQVTIAGQEQWLADGERAVSSDGSLAVAFGWQRPAPVDGALTTVLVSGADGKAFVTSLGETKEIPLAPGAAVAGGAVKLGQVLEHAQLTFGPGTASREWKNPAALVEWTAKGRTREQLVFASAPTWLSVSESQALRFEKRDGEAKAFTSYVTLARDDGARESGVVSVNAPLTLFGWTFYQNSYQRGAMGYVTGLEAVHDPGVPWVFTGFALICLGVAYMFYVEPRFKARTATAPAGAAPADAKAA